MPSFYPKVNPRQPETIEKVVSSLCYLSMGLAGLLYIIIDERNSHSPFFRFNFLQSILLGIFCFLLSWTEQALVSILSGILRLGGGLTSEILPGLASGIGFVTGLISDIGYLLIIYGCIWTILGKQPEIPFISKIVRQQMR